MIAILIVLMVLQAICFGVQVWMFKRMDKRYEQLERDFKALDALYDGLEQVDAQQYADLGTLGNRLTAIENKFVKGGAESEAKPKAEPEKKAATKSKSKKQE